MEYGYEILDVEHKKVDLEAIGRRWCEMDWSASRSGTEDGFCERGDEPSGSIKYWEVLEWLHNR
jgi:hypothetical protein